MTRRIILYNPKLKPRARYLRNHSTKSEIILWHHLKGRERRGFDFHRQKPIDEYIVDFFCHELMLAIERDGITHWEENVIKRDAKKTISLNELGIQILRFEDEMVFDNIDDVIEIIDGYTENFIRTHPLSPSREGKLNLRIRFTMY